MTLAELEKRIDNLEKVLRTELPYVLLTAGNSMCAEIANRVLNTGKAADGGLFTPYSTKGVPAYLYRGRSRSGAGEAKIQKAMKERRLVSYKEFRGMNNLPGSPKNFSFTNDMWRHFGVKKVQYSGEGIFMMSIGGTSQSAADKIAWLSDQEGQAIIQPTREELAALKSKIVKAVVRLA